MLNYCCSITPRYNNIPAHKGYTTVEQSCSDIGYALEVAHNWLLKQDPATDPEVEIIDYKTGIFTVLKLDITELQSERNKGYFETDITLDWNLK